MDKIRVLVVDDSRFMRKQIAGILNSDEEIQCVGFSENGREALKMASKLKPDVITMDVEMPEMDGITALKHLMLKHPIPTIMISAFTREGSEASFNSLRYGAVDVIPKPSRQEKEDLENQKKDIISAVKRAAKAKMEQCRYIRLVGRKNSASERRTEQLSYFSSHFIAVTAGSSQLNLILRSVLDLQPDFQHILLVALSVAPRVAESFTSYLAQHSSVPVMDVWDANPIRKGDCYICTLRNMPLFVTNNGGQLEFRMQSGDFGSEQGQPINTLFKSLAQAVGNSAVGVMMSDARGDGKEGIAEIRQCGGIGIIQERPESLSLSNPDDLRKIADLSVKTGDNASFTPKSFEDSFEGVGDSVDSVEPFLRNLPFFQALSGIDREQLTGYFDLRHLPPGVCIIREGEPGRNFYILLRGHVEVLKDAGTMDQKTLAVLEPGECFGEMSLLSDSPCSATVTSQEPTTVLVLSKEKFHKLLSDNPALHLFFAKLLAQRLDKRQETSTNGKQEGLSGTLETFPIAELIQTVFRQRLTGILFLFNSDQSGQFFFNEGELFNAKVGDLEGIKAFHATLFWSEGRFFFKTLTELNVQREIHENTMALVFDGMRILDEAKSPEISD